MPTGLKNGVWSVRNQSHLQHFAKNSSAGQETGLPKQGQSAAGGWGGGAVFALIIVGHEIRFTQDMSQIVF